MRALAAWRAWRPACATAPPGGRRVGRYDGVMSVISALTGDPLFAHVTLSRSERSPIAALAASILELPAPGV